MQRLSVHLDGKRQTALCPDVGRAAERAADIREKLVEHFVIVRDVRGSEARFNLCITRIVAFVQRAEE